MRVCRVWDDKPKAEGTQAMTITVLGAGAVGTATAWYLRKAGHDVTLGERQAEAGM
jgi:glycine/D-amino acid oxidase-like deaminating enzyme